MRIGSLGDIVFEVSPLGGRTVTPGQISRERKARFEEHKVVGALPRLEFLSPELATVGMPIHLRADMGVNPIREADRLSKLCKDGKVYRLIIAGWNFGYYAVESVQQDMRYTLGDKIFAVDVRVALKEYV
ncbi:phage tail protein [Desulfovibrio falkowii]|uniref:phage tail protein n=1 Tax=Desulfovibrio sp. WGS1351 TaxID=3366814 RepID=UPI00372D6151